MLELVKKLIVELSTLEAHNPKISSSEIAEHFCNTLDKDAIRMMIDNPVIFVLMTYGRGSSNDYGSYQRMQVRVDSSLLGAGESLPVDFNLAESVKNAFYKSCYNQGKLSVDEYNKLIKKEH